uniref:Uncharacterized protein n=1 Tax=Myoviridae sp. ctB3C22 TaxID=2826629 RepID=A0A8S5QWR2_9CAUD|nr:MAG TPA: hypothetical protein [Myoviridae sp. ctB3C22]
MAISEKLYPIRIFLVKDGLFFICELVRIVRKEVEDLFAVKRKKVFPNRIWSFGPPNLIGRLFFIKIIFSHKLNFYANIGKKYEKPHKNKQNYPYFHTIKENG